MNIAHWLARTAQLTPARPAFYLGEALVADYGSVAARTFALAGWLRAQGVGPGDAALYTAALSHGAGIYNCFTCRPARHIFPVSDGFEDALLCESKRMVGAMVN